MSDCHHQTRQRLHQAEQTCRTCGTDHRRRGHSGNTSGVTRRSPDRLRRRHDRFRPRTGHAPRCGSPQPMLDGHHARSAAATRATASRHGHPMAGASRRVQTAARTRASPRCTCCRWTARRGAHHRPAMKDGLSTPHFEPRRHLDSRSTARPRCPLDTRYADRSGPVLSRAPRQTDHRAVFTKV